MSRFVVFVLLTAVTTLGAQIPSPSVPPDQKSVTFNKDVLPILQKNCLMCHRPGDVAPMSFLTYESIDGPDVPLPRITPKLALPTPPFAGNNAPAPGILRPAILRQTR
jgi:hypothetical protein